MSVIKMSVLEKYLNSLNHLFIKRRVFWLLRKKSGADSASLSAMSKRIDRLEKELKRVELLEHSLAQNELVLVKKITDMNQFEEDLKKLVSRNEIEELKKELQRFEEHEQALTENAKFIDELTRELGKVKDSHRMTRKEITSKEHVQKHECEERFSTIKEALDDLEKIRKTHKKKVGHQDLASLKQELHDKIAQIEHQNKVLMKYLKK